MGMLFTLFNMQNSNSTGSQSTEHTGKPKYLEISRICKCTLKNCYKATKFNIKTPNERKSGKRHFSFSCTKYLAVKEDIASRSQTLKDLQLKIKSNST